MRLSPNVCMANSKSSSVMAVQRSFGKWNKNNSSAREAVPQDSSKHRRDTKPLPCHARTHMGAEFFAYDYMVAACKSNPDYKAGEPLKFYGKRWRIANAINRSTVQVDEMLEKLEDAGWIISLQGPRGERKQRRTERGRHTTIEYQVVEHDEYAFKHEDCPGPRYDEATGKPIKPGRMAKPLEYKHIRGIQDSSGFLASLPDFMLEPIAEAMAAKRGVAVKGNPSTDAVEQKAKGKCGPDSES
jgi:hypothetical protein